MCNIVFGWNALPQIPLNLQEIYTNHNMLGPVDFWGVAGGLVKGRVLDQGWQGSKTGSSLVGDKCSVNESYCHPRRYHKCFSRQLNKLQ